jgi:D-amino-acid oxidase
MDEVIVAGSGVIGLTTAVLLAERGVPVRVWGGDGEKDCASAVSGGLCWPYRIEPLREAAGWAVHSFRHFAWFAEQPSLTGVRLVRGTMNGGVVTPEWSELIGSPPRTPIVEMSRYLAYLRDRIAAAGGRCERRTLSSLDEAAAEASAVFNCTGLGARELAHDPSVRPLRGQLVVVENPGIEEWYVASGSDEDGETTYVLPQPYGLLLGGTTEDGSWDTTPDGATAEDIVRRCAAVHPGIARARVIEHRVGLRPFRPSVRLEVERLTDGTPCVHNYGHGGAGVTVSWGCALEGVRLLDEAAGRS